jgi:hypothetical protein
VIVEARIVPRHDSAKLDQKQKTRISTRLEAGLNFLQLHSGGEGRIRTDGTPKRTLDFESSAFDHSATSPDSVVLPPQGLQSGKL